MNVQHILAQKTVTGIASVTPQTPMNDVAAMMSEKRIGAVIVSRDGQRVDGILSERDIVRELGRRGVACMGDRAEDLMTRDVKVCAMADTAEQVLEAMTKGRFRHLPVLVDGKLAGVISIGDVVKARLSEIDMERHALEDMIKGF